MKADLFWMLEYGFKSPFELSRKATKSHNLPGDLTVYGETPWTTLEQIAQKICLSAQDVFVDLGCGTGRTLLFMHYQHGCRVRGYELIPEFVRSFQWLSHRLELGSSAEIYQESWFDADLSGGTVFFLVGSCYDDQHVLKAEQKLRRVPVGSQIVSVSYPISGKNIVLQESFEASFSWGIGTVYIQQCIAISDDIL